MSENLALRRSSAAQDQPTGPIIGVWHEVELVKYFERHIDAGVFDASTHMRNVIVGWCKRNVPEGYWRFAGVTHLSYRLYFYSEEDALMFRLRFSVQ